MSSCDPVLEFISFILFLGVFAKLRNFTISFVMSACLSVRPHGTTRSHRLAFHEIRYSCFFETLPRKFEFY
jgi:hypothetical protein